MGGRENTGDRGIVEGRTAVVRLDKRQKRMQRVKTAEGHATLLCLEKGQSIEHLQRLKTAEFWRARNDYSSRRVTITRLDEGQNTKHLH